MPTGQAIRQEIGRSLRIDEEAALRTIQGTGTSASEITDLPNLGSTLFTSDKFRAWWVREIDGSGNAPDGDKTRANQLVPSTGVLSVSPDFSAALASGDDLELWHARGPDPDDIDRARDRALTQICTRWRSVPLTWPVDGDFLASGVSNWTASSATATKVTKSGPERFVEQTLRVANSGANGYAAQTLNVRENETWNFFVYVQADVGTAAFIVQDLTNSAVVTLNAVEERTTWAGEAWQVLKGTFTIPADCEQISVRLGGQGASDDSYWASLALYPADAKRFVLPSRVTGKGFVGLFDELIGSDFPEVRRTGYHEQPEIVDVGGGQVEAVFQQPPRGSILFWQEFAYYAALQTTYHTAAGRQTGDAASTNCPLPYIKWATLNELTAGQFQREFDSAHALHGAHPFVRKVYSHPGPAYA